MIPTRFKPVYTPTFFLSQPDYYKVISLSAVVGILAGIVVSYFNIFTNWLLDFRIDYMSSSLTATPLVPAIVVILVGALMAGFAFWLTYRFAPEAEGSGIPHIEGALIGEHDIRWHRLLPVKFVATTLAVGSGMVLGRGGPAIQLGGTVGRMVASKASKVLDAQHILVAAGSAAGLAAAFNTPLAAILFVNEEMRRHFSYNLTSVKCVILAVICSTVVMEFLNGQGAILLIPSFTTPPLTALVSFALLGVIFGVVGVLFNYSILRATSWFKLYHDNNLIRLTLTGAILGAIFSLLHISFPILSGGSLPAIMALFSSPAPWATMALFFVLRFLVTIVCFGSSAPGGIFAPVLTLGTFLGLTYGVLVADIGIDYASDVGVYAVAGMGALIAGSLRTPLTAVVLVVEISNNYHLILPILVTCLASTFMAQALGGRPLYDSLLNLKKQDWKL